MQVSLGRAVAAVRRLVYHHARKVESRRGRDAGRERDGWGGRNGGRERSARREGQRCAGFGRRRQGSRRRQGGCRRGLRSRVARAEQEHQNQAKGN